VDVPAARSVSKDTSIRRSVAPPAERAASAGPLGSDAAGFPPCAAATASSSARAESLGAGGAFSAAAVAFDDGLAAAGCALPASFLMVASWRSSISCIERICRFMASSSRLSSSIVCPCVVAGPSALNSATAATTSRLCGRRMHSSRGFVLPCRRTRSRGGA
jgi:hypothetical protein